MLGFRIYEHLLTIVEIYFGNSLGLTRVGLSEDTGCTLVASPGG